MIGQRSYNPSPADPRPFNGFDGSGGAHYGPAADRHSTGRRISTLVSLLDPFHVDPVSRFSLPSLVFHLSSSISYLSSLVPRLSSLVSRPSSLVPRPSSIVFISRPRLSPPVPHLLSLVSRLGALSAVAVVKIETLGRQSAAVPDPEVLSEVPSVGRVGGASGPLLPESD